MEQAKQAFTYGVLSGIVEQKIGAILTVLAAVLCAAPAISPEFCSWRNAVCCGSSHAGDVTGRAFKYRNSVLAVGFSMMMITRRGVGVKEKEIMGLFTKKYLSNTRKPKGFMGKKMVM